MLPQLAQIPLVELQYQQQEVSFAIKNMAEIEDETHGRIEPPHRHNFYAILWHKSGVGHHVVDFTQYQLAPNQVYFLAPGQVHQVVSKTKPEGWVLLFNRTFVEEHGLNWVIIERLSLFDPCTPMPPLQLSPEVSASLESLMDSILQEFMADKVAREQALVGYLQLVLVQLYRIKQEQVRLPADQNSNEQGPSRQQIMVQQFHSLVEVHHLKEHQVNYYATKLSVSPGYLNELIKTYTGRTAKDVIMDRLLLSARREALFSDRSSKEVAYALGFEDPAHFSKFFKTGTGSTFMDFRQQVRTESAIA